MSSSALLKPAEAIEPKFPELSVVRLVRDLDVDDVDKVPVRLPAGSWGTVVMVLGGGDAYIVEFAEPARAIEVLAPGDLSV